MVRKRCRKKGVSSNADKAQFSRPRNQTWLLGQGDGIHRIAKSLSYVQYTMLLDEEPGLSRYWVYSSMILHPRDISLHVGQSPWISDVLVTIQENPLKLCPLASLSGLHALCSLLAPSGLNKVKATLKWCPLNTLWVGCVAYGDVISATRTLQSMLKSCEEEE